MLEVTSQEFQRHFGYYQDQALREPIAITKHGKRRLIVMSETDYLQIKPGERESFYAWELSDADLKDIEAAEYPKGYEHLDDLMD